MSVLNKKNSYIISDFNDLCNIIDIIYNYALQSSLLINGMTTTPTLWYRGQANKEWDIVPSIQRDNKSNIEQVLCHSFYHGASQIMQNHIPKTSYESWLSLMQHYGLPTRLLDWSYSPLVALFFALDNGNYDASMYVLIPEFLNYSQGFGAYVYPIDSYSAKSLLEPAFIKEEPSNKILACFSTSNDLRLYTQRAAFTIHDTFDDLYQLCDNKSIHEIIIPHDKKTYFKRNLELLGYKEGFLFPDLSNVAKQSILRHLKQ